MKLKGMGSIKKESKAKIASVVIHIPCQKKSQPKVHLLWLWKLFFFFFSKNFRVGRERIVKKWGLLPRKSFVHISVLCTIDKTRMIYYYVEVCLCNNNEHRCLYTIILTWKKFSKNAGIFTPKEYRFLVQIDFCCF